MVSENVTLKGRRKVELKAVTRDVQNCCTVYLHGLGDFLERSFVYLWLFVQLNSSYVSGPSKAQPHSDTNLF